MKARIKIFISAILLLLSAGMFVACSNDDFKDLEVEINDDVQVANDFLSKTFPNGLSGYQTIEELKNNYKEIGREWNGEIEDNICFVINSYLGLASLYIGDEKIPDIDFSKISIILGRVWLPGTGYKYDNIKLENSKNETLVTVNFKTLDLDYCVISSYYFYKIVPKFKPGKTIRAEAKCQPLPW